MLHKKDKASVEGGVKIAYLRVYAKLRNETFYSHTEINIRIRQLVEQHVHKPFQKKPGTRHELFINHEQPLLKPLPAERFVVRKVTSSKVYMNYHVWLGQDNHYYSVPYQYIGQRTKIIYDRENVEIFIDFKRIAAHPRSYLSGRYTTLDEHMPPKHLSYKQTKGWDAPYFLSLASKIGQYSEEVFRRVLASKEFVEQTYLSCKGLKRLSDIYTPERFEAACKRALKGTRVNYMMIKNILENNLDQEEDSQGELFPIPKHHNIRGKDNYK